MSVPFYYCMSGQKVFFKRFLIDAKKEKKSAYFALFFSDDYVDDDVFMMMRAP